MPKGHINGNSTQGIEYALGYLHRRVEEYIESIAGTDLNKQMELNTGLARLLFHQGQRAGNQVPLRIQAGGRRSGAQTLEGSIESYGSGSQHSANEGNVKAGKNKRKVSAEGRARMVAAQRKRWAKVKAALKGKKATKKTGSIKDYWANMTPKQRSDEMKKRLAKRTDALAQKILKTAAA